MMMIRRRRNKLVLAAGFCVSFLVGTMMNVLYIPVLYVPTVFDPVRFHHRDGGELSGEVKSGSDRPKPGETGRPHGTSPDPGSLAELRLQIQDRYDEVLRYQRTDNRAYRAQQQQQHRWDSADLLLPQERRRRLMDLRHHHLRTSEYRSRTRAESKDRAVGEGRTSESESGRHWTPVNRPDAFRYRGMNPVTTGTPTAPDCGGLDLNLTTARYLGSGYTKAVHRAAVNGTAPVALKSVDLSGHDMENCVRRFGSGSGEPCYRLASLKLIKEMTLMDRLQHPNVLKLYGVCYQSNSALAQTVTAVTELGTPLDMISLLQSPWEQRFKMCVSVVRLLHHLAHSPVGSVTLLDFRPRQFVLVGAELKVSDLDDATADTPVCHPQSPAAATSCLLEFPARNFTLPCTGGRCEAINEKRNLYNAYRFFFTYLLPHSAPPGLRPLLDNIVNATSELLWDVDETLKQMEKVLHSYTNGLYLNNYTHTAAYRAVPDRSIQGDDYRCWPSYRHDACQLSVFSLQEAELICESHAHCGAFVLTNEITWTGRQLVYFKMGGARLSPAQRWASYIRVGS